MKKLLLLLAVMSALSLRSVAQSRGGLSIGADGALPVGDYSDIYNPGYGASLQYDIPVAYRLNVTISATYLYYEFTNRYRRELQSFGVFQSSAAFVPVKMGIKSYLNENFFSEAQIGATLSTEADEGTAFAYSPGFGYTFNGGLELGVRYEGWTKNNNTFDMFAARLSFRF